MGMMASLVWKDEQWKFGLAEFVRLAWQALGMVALISGVQ